MKTVLSATFLDKGKPAVMLGRKTKGTDEPRGDRSAELPRIDKIGSEEDSTQKAKTRRDCGFFFLKPILKNEMLRERLSSKDHTHPADCTCSKELCSFSECLQRNSLFPDHPLCPSPL